MTARIGVITFPGTLDDVDAALDGARDRFGGGVVTRASVLGPRRDTGALPTNPRLPSDGAPSR